MLFSQRVYWAIHAKARLKGLFLNPSSQIFRAQPALHGPHHGKDNWKQLQMALLLGITISIKSIFIIFVFLQFTLANNKIDSVFLQDLTKILIKIVFGSLSHKYMFLAIFSLLSQFEIEYIPSCSCNPSDPPTGHATKLKLRKTKSCLWKTVVPENIHTPPHRSFFSLNPPSLWKFQSRSHTFL